MLQFSWLLSIEVYKIYLLDLVTGSRNFVVFCNIQYYGIETV